MLEFIWQALGLIGIAIVLFAIFWFFLPPWMSRPLPKKEKKAKWIGKPSVWYETDGMTVIGVDKSTGEDATAMTHFDMDGVTVTPTTDPEFKKYLMGQSHYPRD